MTPAAPAAWQLRVHGVGGPQGPKMLGVLDETDTLTLPPEDVVLPNVSDAPTHIPVDTRSRVLRRLDDTGAEAYEWGGLTLGSLTHALWAVFLPLTVLNVAGWSHGPGAGRAARGVTRVLCTLGTLTYVGWLGYLLLDIVGRQWRAHLLAANLPTPALSLIRCGALPATHALFFLVLGGLWWVNRQSGKAFENCRIDGDAGKWGDGDKVTDNGFFHHAKAHDGQRTRHTVIALAGAIVVVVLGAIARHPMYSPCARLTTIGIGLISLAALQAIVLIGWWLITPWRGGVAQVGLATVGTVMCHAAFAGTAILAVERLSKWPKTTFDRPVIAGPELALADHFLLALVALVLGALVLVATLALRRWTDARYPEPPVLVAKVVHAAVFVGAVAGLSFMASLVAFVVTHLPALDLHLDPRTWWGSARSWYESYELRTNAAQKLGSGALTALPLAVVAVLRKPRDGRLPSVLGNVWDVLTFWPRRFHPFGVPPYAERAIPELRWIIRRHRSRSRPFVLVGHSQGSVLAFAAVGAELGRDAKSTLSFLSFGSPLGTLYASGFPAYFGSDERGAVRTSIEGSGGHWVNLYRSTDAISGPVFPAVASGADPDDQWLPDPRLEPPDPRPPSTPPLERVRPWGKPCGHGFYLADRVARERLAALGP